MTVVPIRIDLELLIDGTAVSVVAEPRVTLTGDPRCPAVHPTEGRCALPVGHDGRHDVAPPAAGDETPAPVDPSSSAEPPVRGGEAARVSSPAPPVGRVTRAQQRMMHARFVELGLPDDERDERLRVTSGVVGRVVGSSNDLTKAEAGKLLDAMARVDTLTDLFGLIDLDVAVAP